MDAAQVMRARREALGITQVQLAEAAGVGRRQIRRYEAGDAQPPLNVAARIARALQITLDELAGLPTDVPQTWELRSD